VVLPPARPPAPIVSRARAVLRARAARFVSKRPLWPFPAGGFRGIPTLHGTKAALTGRFLSARRRSSTERHRPMPVMQRYAELPDEAAELQQEREPGHAAHARYSGTLTGGVRCANHPLRWARPSAIRRAQMSATGPYAGFADGAGELKRERDGGKPRTYIISECSHSVDTGPLLFCRALPPCGCRLASPCGALWPSPCGAASAVPAPPAAPIRARTTAGSAAEVHGVDVTSEPLLENPRDQ
jgi:hypothetical protein